MKWALLAVAVVVALAALIALIGALLPQSHVATVQRHYSAAPESVWTAITDVEAFPGWRSDMTSVRRLPDLDGKARWQEKSKQDSLTFEVMEQVRTARLVTRIADQGLPFGGTWTYELKTENGGTNLAITEQGEVYNPIFRFVSRFVMGHSATIEKFHNGLAAHLAARQP